MAVCLVILCGISISVTVSLLVNIYFLLKNLK